MGGMATIYTQSCSGGLYTQDRLVTTVNAQPGTKVHLTTQASTIVHSSTRGPAHHVTEIAVQEGALIEYLPDPVILFPRAHLISKLKLTITDSSRAVLFDSFLAHDFRGGRREFDVFDNDVRICASNGVPLVVDRYRISGIDFAKRSIGQMGDFSCHGSVIVVAPNIDVSDLIARCRALPSDPDEVMFGVSELPSCIGFSARILSQDAVKMKRLMVQLWELSREAMTGTRPRPRRK